MPKYDVPGAYAEETRFLAPAIDGAATSTAAFLGQTERGPLRPVLITSFSGFRRHFGILPANSSFMPDALNGFFLNGGSRAVVCRIIGAGACVARSAAWWLPMEAIGPGLWGNRVMVKISPGTMGRDDGHATSHFRVQIAYWDVDEPEAGYADPFDASQRNAVPRPTVIEEFDNVGVDPSDPASYLGARLDRESSLIRISSSHDVPIEVAGSAILRLLGGDDGATPTASDYRGGPNADPRNSGLSALDEDEYREVSLVAAPAADPDIVETLVTHCEDNGFRFAVIDSPNAVIDAGALDPRSNRASDYAAYYYPWLIVADLQTGQRRQVPPCGHVLGVYARTDNNRGVWKPPANERVDGVFELAADVDNGIQELLNPRGVNVIRQLPARGIRVWGTRTLSLDSQWRYVNVRRLVSHLQRSLHEGTQWVAFEQNNEQLWARVRTAVHVFLYAEWRKGAFVGLTEVEAFFVVCDGSTMTRDDQQNGRLVLHIGVATLRPGEFSTFRIVQKTADPLT